MTDDNIVSRRRLLTMGAVAATGATNSALAAGEWGGNRIQPSHYTDWSPKPHPMAAETFVLDGVAHCYNHATWNRRYPRAARTTMDTSYKYHFDSVPAHFRMTPEQYDRDWQPEEVMDVMFLESPTDMISMHSVPMYSTNWDGLVSNEKGSYLKGKYPKRVIWYAAIDMFDTFDNITKKIDQVMAQGADGLKFYPTGTDPTTRKPMSWMMDDEKLAFPVWDYAQSKGMKHIAVHKLSGWVAGKTPALGINDLDKAAGRFKDINFHIVHAGEYLFEQQVELMRKHDNITAVMEGPMLFALYDKDFFDGMMEVFMQKLDVNRMIYASTSPNQHAYWIVNHFFDYQPPKGASWKVTDEQKAKILGLNLAAYHNLDAKALKAAAKTDKYGRYVAKNGYREPYIVQRTVEEA